MFSNLNIYMHDYHTAMYNMYMYLNKTLKYCIHFKWLLLCFLANLMCIITHRWLLYVQYYSPGMQQL